MFFCPLSSALTAQNSDTPIVKLNFYLMGRDTVSNANDLLLRDNVDFLNQAFGGWIAFMINSVSTSEHGAYLPDLRKSFLARNIKPMRALVQDVERDDGVNIYLFETYTQDSLQVDLLGFTPVLKALREAYVLESPKFDRIFLAYPALYLKTTLTHEMGHFLGLKHPWEMSSINLDLMGLYTEASINKNHMNYGSLVSEFTTEQLERMQDFTHKFRSYLLVLNKTVKRVE